MHPPSHSRTTQPPSPPSVRRFPTGLAHFVYGVRLADGRTAVVRMSRRADLAAARGAMYWSSLLRPRGVPLPALLHADLSLACWPSGR